MEPTIFKKMRIKATAKIRAFFAPNEFTQLLETQTEFTTVSDETANLLICFVTSHAEYKERMQTLLPMITADTILWIGYKKSTKQHSYDLNRDSLAALAKNDELAPCGMVALSAEWSLLRFKKVKHV